MRARERSEALLLTLLWATWRRARAARCARALIRRFAPPSPASGRRAGVDQHAGSRQELAAVAPPTRTSPSASRQPKGSACPATNPLEAFPYAARITPPTALPPPSPSTPPPPPP